MKKLIILISFTFLSLTNINGQELKAGINGGYPFGSIGENFSLFTGVDLAYTFKITDQLQLGATTGYGRYFSSSNGGSDNEFDGESFNYFPIGGTAKYAVGRYDNWFGGVDFGYAIAIGSDITSDLAGLSYALKTGWQNEVIEIFGYYRGIGNSETKTKTSGNFTTSTTFAKLGSAGVGISYKL